MPRLVMLPEMCVRSFCRRYADCACDAAVEDSDGAVGFWVNSANCSAAVMGAGCGAVICFGCGAVVDCCGCAPFVSNECGFVSKSINGRSFPSCDGNGISPTAASSLAPIELALDSKVFSFGSGAFFDSSVSINAEFFEADVGDKSTNVSSTGFSSSGTLGEKTPLKAASKNATTKWMRIAASSAHEIVRASYS